MTPNDDYMMFPSRARGAFQVKLDPKYEMAG